ncbi:hypothetical protein C5167_025382, partial [Papaver somniferum]
SVDIIAGWILVSISLILPPPQADNDILEKLLVGQDNMSEVEDRISNLPASLLLHILSFVDTRDAARTSVLSKRWKYIWRSIPILGFQCRNSSQTDRFMDFVDRTLEFHDESNIQEFYLMSM